MHYSEQQELKDASWFQAGIPRDICLEVLSKQSPGAFIVRNSNSKPGCFVLSLRVSPPLPKVAHYLILRTSRGYKIKVSVRGGALRVGQFLINFLSSGRVLQRNSPHYEP